MKHRTGCDLYLHVRSCTTKKKKALHQYWEIEYHRNNTYSDLHKANKNGELFY